MTSQEKATELAHEIAEESAKRGDEYGVCFNCGEHKHLDQLRFIEPEDSTSEGFEICSDCEEEVETRSQIYQDELTQEDVVWLQ